MTIKPPTRFYCSEDLGMKLRSGTIINCVNNTPFFEDRKNFYRNMPIDSIYEDERVTDFVYDYCIDCFAVNNLIRFTEKNYEILSQSPYLINSYTEHLNHINCIINMIEKNKISCKCFQYWRSEGECMLTKEYDYLNSVNHSAYREIKHIKMTDPNFYRYRTLNRLYQSNFLIPTEETDTAGNQVKKHDYTQILCELKIWQKYFSREHLTRIKTFTTILNKITIEDCADKILEFL